MSASRVFAGRLAGMMLLGADGESVGRVRDVVVSIRSNRARALGLVVEVAGKRRIFLPMLRIASIDPTEVTMNTSSVSLRPFKSRSGELTVMDDLVGAKVHIDDPEHEHLAGRAVEIADVELELTRTREWDVSRFAVIVRGRLGRRSAPAVVPLTHVHGLSASGAGPQDADAELIAEFKEMRNADVAQVLHELPLDRRARVAGELSDERLADVLAELPDDEQTEILDTFAIERAADILEEMDPDDAADLLGELPDDKADVLLELMDPEESEPVRRLMSFSPDTVGALMTSEPLILTPQATVAEALAHARNPEVPQSLSNLVFVVRPPQATPTGRYLGCVHLQKLLREPPSALIGGILDLDLPALRADDSVETAARYFATYNLVCGPVLDDNQHLLGAVAVDDLLDDLLPEDWRDEDWRDHRSPA
ncbi:Magnesium transporter MgtE [Corynebacterium provencense]|uniref:Magnesium transporter MgtE n=1 Tax=Corynebacterium provencense TaxID=1737425 RepID=A0A2Z3YWK4_9CORY|nr:CBS domain-containing protein [Corynebacterium provencense]AWT25813.1 Magnesium transporter MgtE [Corynebacterium provencense]